MAAAVKMIPRIGPAHGAHNRPVATPSTSDDPIDSFRPAAALDNRDPRATSGRVARSDRAGKASARPNKASNAKAAQRPGFVCADRPVPANRGKRGDDCERQRHSGEKRQRAAREAAVGAGEDERQDRQDAGADDGQHAAEEGKDHNQHGIAPSAVRLA